MDPFRRFIDFIRLIIEFFYPKKEVIAGETVGELRKRLKAGNQKDPEVIVANKKLDKLEGLSDTELGEKKVQVDEVKEVIQNEIAAKEITDKQADSIIKRFKQRNG